MFDKVDSFELNSIEFVVVQKRFGRRRALKINVDIKDWSHIFTEKEFFPLSKILAIVEFMEPCYLAPKNFCLDIAVYDYSMRVVPENLRDYYY